MFRITGFSGEIPRLISRLLPAANAQTAMNVRLNDGALTPLNQPKLVHSFSAAVKTIMRFEGSWIGWETLVNAVPAPVAGNRLYYTGDGVPKMRDSTVVYPLALASPATKPSVSPSGTLDTDTQESILYAYTWVTAFDEESAPSPVSDEVLWSADMVITLSGFDTPPAGRGINRMRIYRSQTATSGATELYFIAELSAATVTWGDDVSNNAIQEAIPSLYYDPPPDELAGLIALPNGMMAAFAGKELCFCEPYIPHAWPEKYRLTTDYDIVALAGFGSSVVVMTTGNPYIVTGTAPENMTMERLELSYPCINAQGVVDLGPVIAYPTTDGLVTVSQDGAQIVTQSLITPQQWHDMRPETFVSGRHGMRYVAAYDYVDDDEVRQRGAVIIDISGAQPFISRAHPYAEAMFSDIGTGALFFLNDGTSVLQWDAPDTPPTRMVWRSKKNVLTALVNFGAILVEGEMDDSADALPALAISDAFIGAPGYVQPALPVIESEMEIGVIADGVEVATIRDMNSIGRLPAGFHALTWEIEVRGTGTVTSISVGASATQLAEE